MTHSRCQFGAGYGAFLFIVLTFILVGCGKSPPPLAPVSGKVTVGGEPLTKGFVVFTPDPAEPSRERVSAAIGENGAYTLNVKGDVGAPKGQYKITVFVGKIGPIRDDAPFQRKYSSLDETPLTVEITDSPAAGAYDFNLAKK